MRQQVAMDSKNDYSSYLQKFNQEQNEHYFTIIPNIFQVNKPSKGFFSLFCLKGFTAAHIYSGYRSHFLYFSSVPLEITSGAFKCSQRQTNLMPTTAASMSILLKINSRQEGR